MVHLRQPFFSIAAAAIFGLLGLLYGANAVADIPITIAMFGFEAVITPVMNYVAAGLMFVMAYFALAHLKNER